MPREPCQSVGEQCALSLNGDTPSVPSKPTSTPKPKPTPKPTPSPKTVAEDPIACDYIYNKNTKKFHETWCSSIKQMKDKNKGYFSGNRQELINRGYKPCKKCTP